MTYHHHHHLHHPHHFHQRNHSHVPFTNLEHSSPKSMKAELKDIFLLLREDQEEEISTTTAATTIINSTVNYASITENFSEKINNNFLPNFAEIWRNGNGTTVTSQDEYYGGTGTYFTSPPETAVAAAAEDGVQLNLLTIDMQFNDGHVLSITVYSVLFILSTIGNVTLLAAILQRKRHSESLSRIDLLLLHLAIADLLVTFLMMPLEIGWAATVYWKAGDWMCRIMAFFRIFGLYLSGFVLVCLAVDRYLAVSYPMQGLASTKRAKIMLSGAWLLSILCSFPQVLIFHVENHPNFPWYTQCVTFNSFSKPEYELLYKLFGLIMMYAFPFILLVVLYGSIALELYKMSYSSVNDLEITGGFQRRRIENLERAKVKSVQMTFVIAAAFLICWTPYYVMCIWYWTDPESAKNVDQRIQRGLFLFACTNSTVNPVVYGIFNIKNVFCREQRVNLIIHAV